GPLEVHGRGRPASNASHRRDAPAVGPLQDACVVDQGHRSLTAYPAVHAPLPRSRPDRRRWHPPGGTRWLGGVHRPSATGPRRLAGRSAPDLRRVARRRTPAASPSASARASASAVRDRLEVPSRGLLHVPCRSVGSSPARQPAHLLPSNWNEILALP